jgi:transposase
MGKIKHSSFQIKANFVSAHQSKYKSEENHPSISL